jgi:hypothetical protein
MLLLLLDYQRVSVLQGVFGPPVEVPHDFRPLFGALVLLDALEQLDVFLGFPWALLEVGIEVAVPVLAALLGVAEDLVLAVVEKVEPLRDELPVLAVLRLALETLLVDQLGQQVALLVAPVVRGEVDFLETEPLEHTRLSSDARYEGGEHGPILRILHKMTVTSSFSMSVYPLLSAYLEMTHTSICTSSSLQFFLIRLFLIILSSTKLTSRSAGSSPSGSSRRS